MVSIFLFIPDLVLTKTGQGENRVRGKTLCITHRFSVV